MDEFKPHDNTDILDDYTAKFKRTWRTLFRCLMLVGVSLTLCMILIIIIKLPTCPDCKQNQQMLNIVTHLSKEFGGFSSSVVSMLNQITYGVTVLTPIKQNSMENAIISRVRDYCKMQVHINNTQDCINYEPLHDSEYLDGINKFFIPEQEGITLSFGPLLDYPNFIPTATTPHGCTRIPSFSLGNKHWCYTHNIILQGCADSSVSNQYVSMGSLQTLKSGLPFFKVTHAHYLSDGRNRKSCSIVAVPGGCLLYCMIVTKLEQEDYASLEPETQLLTFIGYNGTIFERSINPTSLKGNWATMVPGAGAGIFYYNKVIFPAYGGAISGSSVYQSETGKYLLKNSVKLPCSMSQQEKVSEAQNSYTLHYFSQRMIKSAFLICDWDQIYTTNCTILTPSNDQVFMGAEGRLYAIGDQIYYYQRGSSWWPFPALYHVVLNMSGQNPTLTSVTLKQIEVAPRPGMSTCPGNHACPQECITGVYQDIWPLSIPRDSTSESFKSFLTGMYLNDPLVRENPTFYLARNLGIIVEERFKEYHQIAAYSSTTCFVQTSTSKLYCVYLLEVGSATIGEFQIIPFLREIVTNAKLNLSQ
uniref:HN n=1 Tax=Eptesicus fuscus orthorubulavirus TaxID=2884705 RepID=A0A8K1JZR0_9MONO|nr:HN [Eptesicus fuscus orthorubulavirus]